MEQFICPNVLVITGKVVQRVGHIFFGKISYGQLKNDNLWKLMKTYNKTRGTNPIFSNKISYHIASFGIGAL